MAQKIIFRTGAASSWSTTNPVLSEGEIGVDNTNNNFKIGNGSTAWNSLSTALTASPTQTAPFRSLGDGSDGNVTISSGVTTLVRDMYYNNLTINGTGSIYTNGFRIFVKNILNLSGAPTGAINFNGANGNNASGAVGGAQVAVPSSASVGQGTQGSAGANGIITGGAGSATVSVAGNNGSGSNNSGGGGSALNTYTFTITAGNTASIAAIYTDGVTNYYVNTALLVAATTIQVLGSAPPNGTAGTLTFVSGTGTGPIIYSGVTVTTSSGGLAQGGSVASSVGFTKRWATNLIRGATLLLGGSGGRGGSSGAGDGSNLSGAGGGGGNGGGVVALYANIILKNSSTSSGAIQANGGNGGNGGNATIGTTGGGGGASGGGGGWVYLAYNYISGPAITNLIQVNGGAGGNGGAGYGSQNPNQSAGTGGQGSYGGRITLFSILNQTGIEVYGDATASKNPEVTSGTSVSAPFPAIGAMGGQPGLSQLTI
jgi:hypothetical protein